MCIILPVEFINYIVSGEDITKLKDGGIRKSIIVKGEGSLGPNDGGMCKGENFSDECGLCYPFGHMWYYSLASMLTHCMYQYVLLY